MKFYGLGNLFPSKNLLIMKIVIFTLLIGILPVYAGSYAQETTSGQQQSKTVTGTVTDVSGEQLPGVSILVKGTTIGIITDVDGYYSLANVPDNAILVFSYVGMKAQEIAVKGKAVINAVLQEDAVGLEEVVAIGYGFVRKSDLTGSVTSLSADRLMDKPVFNLAQALAGKAAGVKIVERTGAPGSNPMIRIRGTNSINSGNEPL
ncbi:MAG: carboxypeptidase-like regulatory domain-containing protein, partial [Tannerella sp.]|nr:carboxypeptidase-like regulatory domain-containing protein [Tannerella sp.]